MTDARRGKMYQCQQCEANGKRYLAVRYRVVAHIYKYHLSLDQAPFYCTLCLLRCSSKSALYNHVHKYKRHRLAASEIGINNSERYLVENPSPASVSLGKDFVEASILEQAASSIDDQEPDEDGEFFRDPFPAIQPSHRSTSNETPAPGLISVQMTPEMLAVFLGQQKSPLPVPASTLGATPQRYTPALPEPASSQAPLYKPTPIQAKASAMAKTTKLAPLTSGKSAFTVNAQVPVPAAVAPLVCAPASSLVTPVMSPENILPQLLEPSSGASELDFGGDEDWLTAELLGSNANQEESKPDNQTEEPTPKRQRVEDVPEQASTPAPAWPNIIEAVDKVLEQRLKPLVEGFDHTARAVRVIEKALTGLTEVLGKVNRNLERMGEEQRRENDRRRRDAEDRRRESEDNKENHFRKSTLKSVINKK